MRDDTLLLLRRLGELEARMQTAGFWDDDREAARTTHEHANIMWELERRGYGHPVGGSPWP